jgi:transposase-like protein
MKAKQEPVQSKLQVKRVMVGLKELNAMTKAATQVHTGQVSLIEAAGLFGVSRYKIEKWIAMLTVAREDGSIGMVDNDLKISVINAVYHDGMSHKSAAEKFGVHSSIIRIWLKLRTDPAVVQQFTKQMRKAIPKADEYERAKVVAEINGGVLRISQASRTYGVSRGEISRWITIHTKINLKSTLKDPLYCSMTVEEKNKELEEQLRQAQKLLEEARLKISGLETLIEVAEEKFEIQIKKKRGSKPPGE